MYKQRATMFVRVPLFFLLQVIIARGQHAGFHNRMFGSYDASNGDFPYVTFHVMINGAKIDSCTGSIIAKFWVITAAHCIKPGQNPKDHLVVAGNVDLANYVQVRLSYIPLSQGIDEKTYNVQERRATALFTHPNYRPPGHHDVGLIKVGKPFKFNDLVQPIPISKVPFTPQTNCTIAGFGRVEGDVRPYILQYVSGMPANPSGLCRFKTVHNDSICLGQTFRGMCSGDSGGALVCGGKLMGIASYTFSSLPNCGLGVNEQYYADIQDSRSWISDTKDTNKANRKS